MFSGLNALCKSTYSYIFSHGNSSPHDILRLIRKRSQKSHIKLKHIKLIILQKIKRRITAAEVIHPYLIAGISETLDNHSHELLIGGDHALGYLYMNIISWNLVFLNSLLDYLHHVTHDKVQSRKVDGNRYNRLLSKNALMKNLADLFDNIGIQLMYATVLLKYSDESVRLQEAMVRIIPSYQGFHTAQL